MFIIMKYKVLKKYVYYFRAKNNIIEKYTRKGRKVVKYCYMLFNSDVII